MRNRGKDSKRGGRAGRLREIGRREIIGDRGEKMGLEGLRRKIVP